jgi:hypothetical protein
MHASQLPVRPGFIIVRCDGLCNPFASTEPPAQFAVNIPKRQA